MLEVAWGTECGAADLQTEDGHEDDEEDESEGLHFVSVDDERESRVLLHHVVEDDPQHVDEPEPEARVVPQRQQVLGNRQEPRLFETPE